MSSAGMPANDSFVKSRFSAGRGSAANGIDPEVLQLAEGGGGTQTAAPQVQPSPGVATPPSAGPSQPGLPLGLRFQQAIGSAAQTMKADMGASWDKLKGDLIASTGLGPEAREAFQKGSFWDQMKSQWHSQVAAGALPLDALNTVLSPLTGAVDAGSDAVSKGVFSVLPEVPGYGHKELRAALNTAASLMMPAKAGAGAIAEAGTGAAEAGDAAVKPGAPAKVDPGVQAEPDAAVQPQPVSGSEKPETAASHDPGLSGEGADVPTEGGPAPFRLADSVDRPGKQLKVTPEIRDQAAAYFQGKRADNPIQASLEGLSADEDLNGTVADVARFMPQGKVKPDDIRDMNAYSLNMSPDEVMQRLVPQYPSDELQMAAGSIVNSAATEMRSFAQAAMENPTPENQEKAVRAYAQLNDVIGKFRDAGTDLGRGMRARQATTAARDVYTNAIHQVIADVGPENVDEAIRKVAALPDPKTVSPFVSSLRTMGGRDGLLYGWYNWLLSNPATVVKKIASDGAVATWNTAVRYAAEKFGSGDVRPGEAAALWNGYVGSMRDGLNAAAKALKAGESQFWGDYQTMDGRVITPTDNHPPEPISQDNPTASAVQMMRSALPTSWIGAADDFAKVVNYRAEARALAYRDGMIKGLANDDLSNHIAQTMNNMPQHIHVQAVNSALRNTFQEPLSGIAEKLQDIVDRINIPVPGLGIDLPLGRIIMPFVKVPANIAKFAYRNGPLAAAIPSAAVKAELGAGGATRDLALARMGLGTAVSAIALPFMIGGNITGHGPTDPQLNRAWVAAGNKPYSVRVGGTWYSYNRIEPIGMHMSALADTAETLKFAHDEDAEQLAWSMAFGVGDAMLSKTYMQGMSDFLNALHDPQGEGKYYGDKVVASMALPQGAAALATSIDPWLRQHYGLLSAIQARTPGLASNLPPVRDLWGQPVPHDKGFLPFNTDQTMANLLSPVQMAPAGNAQPIDKWIWDNRTAFPDADNGRLGLTRPGQVQSFDTGKVSVPIRLTEKQLDRLREQTGNGLKDPATGLGARDALNALVGGTYPQAGTQNQWNGASPAARAVMVLKVFNKYRDGAKRQLLSESPDIQASLAEKSNSRIEALRAPTMGDAQ